MPEPTSIAVCLCTYRRPKWLARLLASLDAQTFAGETPRIEIIVVDNDPDGDAKATVDSVSCQWPVRVIRDGTGGISHARNTSVRAVDDSFEWIAFIDDDEYADPTWLDTLLACARTYKCDVVAGPVIGELPDNAPEWIERGGFFQRDRFPTGTRRDRAYTNNTLANRRVVRSMDPIFDETFTYAGGADTFLFRRIYQSGHTIVWCDEAVVYESIPPTRARAGWILRRAFRVGANNAQHEIRLKGSLIGRTRALAIAAVRASQCVVLLLPSCVIGKHAVIRQCRWIAYASGLLAGCAGIAYHEYRGTHHGE